MRRRNYGRVYALKLMFSLCAIGQDKGPATMMMIIIVIYGKGGVVCAVVVLSRSLSR